MENECQQYSYPKQRKYSKIEQRGVACEKTMAQVLNLSAPNRTVSKSSPTCSESSRSRYASLTRHENVNQTWSSLQQKLNCNGRFSCLFADNRREVLKFCIFDVYSFGVFGYWGIFLGTDYLLLKCIVLAEI